MKAVGGGLAGYAKPALFSLGLHLAVVAAAVGLAGGESSRPRPLVAIEVVAAIPGEASPGPRTFTRPDDARGSKEQSRSSDEPDAPPDRADSRADRPDDAVGETAKNREGVAAEPKGRESSESVSDLASDSEPVSVAENPTPLPEPKPELPPEVRPQVQAAAPIPQRKPAPTQSAIESPEADRLEQDIETAKQLGVLPGRPPAGADAKAETLSEAGNGAAAPTPIALRGGNPEPRYPYAARKRGEEGRVIVRVRVSTAGRVEAARIHRSSGSRALDDAALDAVEDWRFVPATVDGVAVPGTVDVPVVFRLEG